MATVSYQLVSTCICTRRVTVVKVAMVSYHSVFNQKRFAEIQQFISVAMAMIAVLEWASRVTVLKNSDGFVPECLNRNGFAETQQLSSDGDDHTVLMGMQSHST